MRRAAGPAKALRQPRQLVDALLAESFPTEFTVERKTGAGARGRHWEGA